MIVETDDGSMETLLQRKCPVCGRKHRSVKAAQWCLTEVDRRLEREDEEIRYATESMSSGRPLSHMDYAYRRTLGERP